MAIAFAGFLYTTAGVAVNAATVNLYDVNTTTPVRATTTTNSSGYWSISHGTDGQFDVEIVNGATTRRIKYNNSIQMLRVETRNFRLDGSTSGRITMNAAASTTDYTLTWPGAVGAASTYLQTDASGVLSWVANTAAIAREGGQTTEATTTSTTAVDLLTASSLTIAAGEPFFFVYSGRKTSGAAARVGCGLKLNTTIVSTPVADGTRYGYMSGASNQADDGSCHHRFGARVTNYRNAGEGRLANYPTAGGTAITMENTSSMLVTAVPPIATYTDIVIEGISGDALITLGADELQVYSEAAS